MVRADAGLLLVESDRYDAVNHAFASALLAGLHCTNATWTQAHDMLQAVSITHPLDETGVMRLLRVVLCTLCLGVTASCSEMIERMAPAEANRFGHAYIAALHDEGVDGVRDLTTPQAVALDGFVSDIRQMQAELPPGPLETVELKAFEVSRSSGSPPTTRLRYTVRNGTAAAVVELWLEEVDGRLAVDTVWVGRLGSE